MWPERLFRIKIINKSYTVIFVLQKYIRENDQESLKKFIDNPFRQNLGKYRYYHFPIISDARGSGGRHWTLAIFDTLVGLWKFTTRCGREQDNIRTHMLASSHSWYAFIQNCITYKSNVVVKRKYNL